MNWTEEAKKLAIEIDNHLHLLTVEQLDSARRLEAKIVAAKNWDIEQALCQTYVKQFSKLIKKS